MEKLLFPLVLCLSSDGCFVVAHQELQAFVCGREALTGVEQPHADVGNVGLVLYTVEKACDVRPCALRFDSFEILVW